MNKITVACEINTSLEKVWEYFTDPKHIINWYFASDDWHAPRAENVLRVGAKFLTRMEAKDGSFGFDFEGEYTAVDMYKLIEYKLADNRFISIVFETFDNKTKVTETFDAEEINPLDMQKAGWQSILDNFKKYVEDQK